MFSLERALIGFAAAVGDSVSRRPAMHVVGSLVAFGLLAVGILLVEVESDVFKLWVRAPYYVGRDILFFLSSFEDDDDVCSLSSRLVEYHHHHHHLCVCVSARGSVVRCDSKARRRQTDRARATLFFGRSRSSFFFLLTQTRIVFGRDGEEPKTYIFRWREDERVILTYRQQTFLSLSLLCVCCLF